MTEATPDFTRIYQSWADAMRQQDAAWFDDLEHADFVYVGPDGVQKDKASHIAQATRGVGGELGTEVEQVRRFGDVAIVTGTHWVRSEVPTGAGLSETVVEQMKRGVRIRFSSVWLEEAASWRLVHHHTTRLESVGAGS